MQVGSDSDSKMGEFKIHVLRVADQVFLDMFPNETVAPLNDVYASHFGPDSSLPSRHPDAAFYKAVEPGNGLAQEVPEGES